MDMNTIGEMIWSALFDIYVVHIIVPALMHPYITIGTLMTALVVTTWRELT